MERKLSILITIASAILLVCALCTVMIEASPKVKVPNHIQESTTAYQRVFSATNTATSRARTASSANRQSSSGGDDNSGDKEATIAKGISELIAAAKRNAAETARKLYILTFEGVITPERKKLIEHVIDQPLDHYWPDDSYIVSLTSAQHAALTNNADAYSVSLMDYEPAWKIDESVVKNNEKRKQQDEERFRQREAYKSRTTTASASKEAERRSSTLETILVAVDESKPGKYLVTLRKTRPDWSLADAATKATLWSQQFTAAIGLVVAVKAESADKLSVQFPSTAAESVMLALSQFPEVKFIEYLTPMKAQDLSASALTQNGRSTSGSYTSTSIWDRGLRGEGEIIGCSDTGIDYDHSFFRDARIPVPFNTTNFNHRKIVQYIDYANRNDDIEGHGTHVTGILVGHPEDTKAWNYNDRGVAPNAKLAFFDLGDDDSFSVPVDLKTVLFPPAYSANARVHSNSWGGSGNVYSTYSQAVDQYMWDNKDFLAVFSAGNLGPQAGSVSHPSTAKNCLTVGASNSVYNSFDVIPANFGASLDGTSISGTVIAAEPFDACSPLTNDVKGKIVLVSTSAVMCSDEERARNAQAAGAIGVLIALNDTTDNSFSDGSGSDIRVPVLITFYYVSLYYKYYLDNKIPITTTMYSDFITYEPCLFHAVDRVSSFSGRGPTSDGRIKPDIVAPGSFIISAASDGNINYNLAQSAVAAKEGTSMATPVAAASAAIVRQYFREGWYPTGAKTPANSIRPSGALLKAMLIHSAQAVETVSPNMNQGYGRLQLDKVLAFPNSGFKLFVSDNNTLETQDVNYFCFNVQGGASQLKVTLSYTDYPGTPGAPVVLVNDIDLTVYSPSTFWTGNAQGPNKEGGDRLNNNEQVVIQSPPPGRYIVLVEGKKIPQGPQPYALVITGQFDAVTACPTITATCPYNCNNKGNCINGACYCSESYAGRYCESFVAPLTHNVTVAASTGAQEWNYFAINTPAEFVGKDLHISVNRTAGSGEYVSYVKLNSYPTTQSYDATNEGAVVDATSQNYASTTVVSNAQSGRYYVGILGYQASSFNVTATYKEPPAPAVVEEATTQDFGEYILQMCVKNAVVCSVSGVVITAVAVAVLTVLIVASVKIGLAKQRAKNSRNIFDTKRGKTFHEVMQDYQSMGDEDLQ